MINMEIMERMTLRETRNERFRGLAMFVDVKRSVAMVPP